jgi:hypothetical protein
MRSTMGWQPGRPKRSLMRAATARTRVSRFWYSSMETRDGAAHWTNENWPIQRGSSSSRRSIAAKRSRMPLV